MTGTAAQVGVGDRGVLLFGLAYHWRMPRRRSQLPRLRLLRSRKRVSEEVLDAVLGAHQPVRRGAAGAGHLDGGMTSDRLPDQLVLAGFEVDEEDVLAVAQHVLEFLEARVRRLEGRRPPR